MALGLAFLSYISFRLEYCLRKREGELWPLCAQRPLREERQRERDRYCEEVCSRDFVTHILNIIKTKFLWT